MAESREDRIMKLATSLKASGFAKTDSQARMLAEDMIGTEDKVQQRFEEQHTKTQDFLKTAKNLKEDRTLKPEPKKETVQIQQIKQERKEPVRSFDEEAHEQIKQLQEVKTDGHYGSKSLQDMMLDQIEEEHHDIKSIEEVSEEYKHRHVEEIKPVFEQPKQEENLVEEPKTTELPLEPEIDIPPEQKPQLDTNKLVEMMEEDGKMEEHTREIKEKPKIIKPKEEYAENNVDLGAIFGAKK